MSCDNKPIDQASSNKASEPATVWEHFVLHKASEKKVMLFDLEIADRDKRPKSSFFRTSDGRKRKISALDAATTTAMAITERQRSASAPVVVGTTISLPSKTAATDSEDDTTETETVAGGVKNHQASNTASLAPVYSFASFTTNSTSASPSFNSVTLDSGHSVKFGPDQLLAMSPSTLHDDAERQAALVKVRPTAGLTMSRRLLADEGVSLAKGVVRGEELMMSGSLHLEDGRCKICAARERAMGGLEESGIVAL